MVTDLIFESASEVIYDPLLVTTTVTVTVRNQGAEDLSNLGLYIKPASLAGEFTYAATYAPQTDYEDLLTWGTAETGGLTVTLPQNTGPDVETIISRTAGASVATKLPFQDLDADAEAEFTIEFAAPSGEPARRFYIDVVIE